MCAGFYKQENASAYITNFIYFSHVAINKKTQLTNVSAKSASVY